MNGTGAGYHNDIPAGLEFVFVQTVDLPDAAAGAVVGNIVASGDSVLRIEACTVDGIDQKCLWGYYENRTALPVGAVAYVSVKNPRDFKVCYQKNPSDTNQTCEYMDLNITNATIAGYTKSEKYTDADGTEQERQVFAQSNRSTGGRIDIETIFAQDQFKDATDKACYKYNKMGPWTSDCDDAWVKLDGTIQRVTNRPPAMVVDVKDRGMGWKRSNWRDFVSQYGNHKIVGRTGNGVASNLDNTGKPKQLSDGNFTPLYQDSEDGGIIDLSNKARLKGTLTGAGVGGGMGAFAGYQGAQQDIEERWVTAVREYKDSLQKVYCATGNRFLSHYNDTVIIPHMNDK